jgi:hypothetical protein
MFEHPYRFLSVEKAAIRRRNELLPFIYTAVAEAAMSGEDGEDGYSVSTDYSTDIKDGSTDLENSLKDKDFSLTLIRPLYHEFPEEKAAYE